MPSLGRTDESAGREQNGLEETRQTNTRREPSTDPRQPRKRKVTGSARPCPQTGRQSNDPANASTKSGAGDFRRRSKRSYIPRKALRSPIARGISNTPSDQAGERSRHPDRTHRLGASHRHESGPIRHTPERRTATQDRRERVHPSGKYEARGRNAVFGIRRHGRSF